MIARLGAVLALEAREAGTVFKEVRETITAFSLNPGLDLAIISGYGSDLKKGLG